jgi:hypothetical protein
MCILRFLSTQTLTFSVLCWQGKHDLVHQGVLVNHSKFLSPIKLSADPVVVVSDDDDDFDIDDRPRVSSILPGKAKRKLPFDDVRSPHILASATHFGGGIIDANDSHRHDGASSSGIAPSQRRLLVTSVFSATVKWIPVEPSTKAWLEKKLRAEKEDMRMVAKPVGATKRTTEWAFQVIVEQLMDSCCV